MYIFDITIRHDEQHNVRELQRLRPATMPNSNMPVECQGQQGEYFGYALVAADFTADGHTDLAVAAPFRSRSKDTFDNGAVYVYTSSFAGLRCRSRLQPTHTSDGARFGSALSRLGDINGDGYDDLAVGAPHESGGGAVYIYLGCERGLSERPSQRLTAPATPERAAAAQPQWFGMALSRGVDIDADGFNDLAVGAPGGAGSVYVFRSYPVAKIVAFLKAPSQIADSDGRLSFDVCWQVLKIRTTRVEIRIEMDSRHGRLTTTDATASRSILMHRTARSHQQCSTYVVNVRFDPLLVFETMPLNLTFNVQPAHRMPDSNVTEFDHVMIDPQQVRTNQQNVSFYTGCERTRCVADLRVKTNVSDTLSYAISSNRVLGIEYAVYNEGETAYLPTVNVTIEPASVRFVALQSGCFLVGDRSNQLLCHLNGRRPLRRGERAVIAVSLDIASVPADAADGRVYVRALASSFSDELTMADNAYRLQIELFEQSVVNVTGSSSVRTQILPSQEKKLQVTQVLKLCNNGPSAIAAAEMAVRFPARFVGEKNGSLQSSGVTLDDITVSTLVLGL